MMINTSKSPGPIINSFSYAQGNTLGNRNNGLTPVGGSNWNNGISTSNHANPSMLMTQQFSNFFDSGENMTRERFAKSREQARRN
jgi:hypothetical protein